MIGCDTLNKKSRKAGTVERRGNKRDNVAARHETVDMS